MSVHIGAKTGDVADTVLLPGDPLRAQFIAEQYLSDAYCYNNVRGMLGYTGYYKGQRVSVQGTGMGLPSISIYAQELIQAYGAKRLLRVGSSGAMQADINLRDVILAQASCTDSSMNQHRFYGYDYSPIADFSLLKAAYETGQEMQLNPRVGNVFSSDRFYRDDNSGVQKLMDYGVLGVDMETSALYTLAAKFGVSALTILTVSDNLITGEEMTAEEKQNSLTDMMQLALDTAVL